ncbi:MAG: ATP-binding protein [Thermoplasmata archaeon]
MRTQKTTGGGPTLRKIIALVMLSYLIVSFAVPYTAVSQSEEDVLRIGMYENPPKIFTDEYGNEMGIFPAIIEYIAEEEGWEIEYVHGSFSQGLERLRNGEIDIMQDVAWSEERDEIYAFNNETVVPDWGRLYSRTDIDIQTFLDLEGKTIAVMEEGIYNIGPEGIRTLVDSFEINATFLEYPSYEDIFETLDNGGADLGAVNRFFGQRFQNEYDVDQTPVIFTPISIRFAFDKNHTETPERITKIDQHLKEMKDDPDSIYYRSIDEFLGGDGESGRVEVFPTWVKYTIFIIAVGTVFLIGTSIVLKRKVNQRTSELREDIKKRREVEIELRKHEENLEKTVQQRTEELQDSLEELKTFSYSVSHDLRAPVRAMEGFSSILLEDYSDELDQTGRDYLKRIHNSSQNMDRLISDLLKYGRLTHEAKEVKRVSLENVVKDVISDLEDEIEDSGAHLKTTGVFPDVTANKTMLKQCISNLIKNAIKFVENGKRPEIEISGEKVGNEARVEVKDNGIGIPEEHQEKIFDVFERLHGRETYSGTGVGLAIVRKGIERMGGEIGVESTPGEGSTFWITLPLGEKNLEKK